MKCEECLFQVEEYLERETDLGFAEPVLEHISGCRECKDFYDYLRMEQKVFSTYLQNIEASPALWAGLEAHIKAEKTARPPVAALAAAVTGLPKSRGSRFRFTFQPGRFNYALSGCLALLLVAVFTGLLMNLVSDKTSFGPKAERPIEIGGSGRVPEELSKLANLGNQIEPPEKKGTRATEPPNNSYRTRKNPERKLPGTGPASSGVRQKSRPAAQKAIPADPLSKPKNENFHGKDPMADKSLNAAFEAAPKPSDGLEGETRKQVERVELLLRSFRNTPMTEGELAVQVTYDKNQARKLLQKNIQLRQGAENKGETDIEEVLASLEPFLLDIANLPDEVSPDEVRRIQTRIREQQIVAALQIY